LPLLIFWSGLWAYTRYCVVLSLDSQRTEEYRADKFLVQ
jgi:hypothetical protein